MRKKTTLFLAILMISLTVLSAAAMAETKLGQAIYAAHGTKAFCVATVAMDGDVIQSALIEEFQFCAPEGFASVPNPETFTNADGNILASKRNSDEGYSANMKEKGGSTQNLVTSYKAIEAFVVGKTVAELEAAIEGKDAAAAIDVVASCTLADTLGYLQAIIAAAKNVQ